MRFSVIVPTFNSSLVLERAVKSVLNQSLSPLELLVVDDGSTDNSEEIIRAYGDRVRYFRLSHTGFPAIVRNHGILKCRGTHVAFLDSDDAWHSDKLAKVAEAISEHPDAGVYYSDFIAVDENLQFGNLVRCRNISQNAYRSLLGANPIATSTVVVRRECFSACGMFREEIRGPEDWDLWIRISRKFAIVHIPLPLVEYTQHKTVPCLSSSPDFFSNQRKVVERAFEADPEITGMQKRCILSSLHYGAARAEMFRRRDGAAVRHLVSSLRYNPIYLQSYAFLPIASIKFLVRATARFRILGSSASQ
jgi:glycosyltransferase involved in cell wall biosynthesis